MQEQQIKSFRKLKFNKINLYLFCYEEEESRRINSSETIVFSLVKPSGKCIFKIMTILNLFVRWHGYQFTLDIFSTLHWLVSCSQCVNFTQKKGCVKSSMCAAWIDIFHLFRRGNRKPEWVWTSYYTTVFAY